MFDRTSVRFRGRLAATAVRLAAAAVLVVPAASSFGATVAASTATAAGTSVTVNTVTISNILNISATNGYNLDVQDATGGVQLFRFPTTAFASFTPAVGQIIDVTATNSPFGGNPEFSNVGAAVTLDSPTSTFVPTTVNTTTLNAAKTTPLLGETVTLTGVTFATTGNFAASTSYTVSDALGSSTLFIPSATSASQVAALAGQAIPTGPVNVTGFVDYFSTSSIIELYPTAITAVSTPEPASLGLIAVGSTLLAARRKSRRA